MPSGDWRLLENRIQTTLGLCQSYDWFELLCGGKAVGLLWPRMQRYTRLYSSRGCIREHAWVACAGVSVMAVQHLCFAAFDCQQVAVLLQWVRLR
jgi:hypothetical protein